MFFFIIIILLHTVQITMKAKISWLSTCIAHLQNQSILKNISLKTEDPDHYVAMQADLGLHCLHIL